MALDLNALIQLNQGLGYYGAGGGKPPEGTQIGQALTGTGQGLQSAGQGISQGNELYNQILKNAFAQKQMQQAQQPVSSFFPDGNIPESLKPFGAMPLGTAGQVGQLYEGVTGAGVNAAYKNAMAQKAFSQTDINKEKLSESTDMIHYSPTTGEQHDQAQLGDIYGKRTDANKAAVQFGLQQAKTNTTKLDPQTVENEADKYNLTGQMPSLGMGSNIARMQIMQRAAEKLKQNGQDARSVIANKMAIQAGQQELGAVQKNQGVIGSFGKTLDGVTNLLQDASTKVGNDPLNTGVPILQRWINAGKTEIAGDTDVNNLNTLINTAQAEYSRYMNTVTGGGNVADEATKRVQQNLAGSKTPEQIKGWIDTIRNEKNIRDQAYKDQINEVKSNLFDIQGSAKSPGSQTTQPANPAPTQPKNQNQSVTPGPLGTMIRNGITYKKQSDGLWHKM